MMLLISVLVGLAGVSDIDDSPIIAARHHTWVEYVNVVAAIVFVGLVDLDLRETAAALSWASATAIRATLTWIRVSSHFRAFGSSIKSVIMLIRIVNIKPGKKCIKHIMHEKAFNLTRSNSAFISPLVLTLALAHNIVRKNCLVISLKSPTTRDFNSGTFITIMQNFTKTVEFVFWHALAFFVISSDVAPATVRSVLAADEHL